MTRGDRLQAIAHRGEVSVLVVGGGVNGIGLFRELALQGVDTILVEKSDFCSGASSASTRIMHGGLRYLENREFRLVREALRERNRLVRNAPHYVRPLPTTIPIFNWTGGLLSALGKFMGLRVQSNVTGALPFKIGLSLYDIFAGNEAVLPAHHFQSRRASLAARPQLPSNIVCTATYYDAWLSYPERLCVELIQDAEAQCADVCALNYVRLEGANGDRVILKDEMTGQSYEIKPRIVVNASGAWIDFTNRALARQTQYIGGTKGSHIVLEHPELLAATRGEMLYFANTDGRICIFYPFYGKVIAGTTDIPVSDPETALCDDGEVDYILESMRRVFPAIAVDRSHIVYRFCGVRPLPRSDSATPGEVSRDHRCAVIPPGKAIDFPIYSLIGGKWTTFRAFGEQVADNILKYLAKPRLSSSADLPMGGGKGYPTTANEKSIWLASLSEKTHLPLMRLEVLLDRYGTRAEGVAQFLSAGPDQPLGCLPEYSVREIQCVASQEIIVHLDDLILRRTLMALMGQLTLGLLEELARVLAPVLVWPEQQVRLEIERTVKILSEIHGVILPECGSKP